MKKRTLFSIAAALILVIATSAVLVGCSGTYTQDALADSPGADAAVASNGGMAVMVGDWLYFINGYAGQDAANEFGEAVKGAIMRVKYGQDGNPDLSTVQTVVAKNVYNTTATSSLVVENGYIYFTTPNDESDSDGNAKTSEMVLMRATLDGSRIETIAEFSDYTATYRVSDNFVVYRNSSSELRLIDLNSKRFTDTLIDEGVSAVTIAPYSDGANSMEDVVFYTKSSDNAYDTHNIVYAYKAGGAVKAVINGRDSYPSESLPHAGGYSITLVGVRFEGEGVRLQYTKTDSGTNTKSTGVYSYYFDTALNFDSASEVRYTVGTTYTSLWYLDADNILAVDSDSVDYIFASDSAATGWEVRRNVIQVSSATIVDATMIAEPSGEVELGIYYINSSSVYRLAVTVNKSDPADLNYDSVELVFDSAYSSDWLTLDLVGNIVYFFNSDVLNNIYYVNLGEVNPRNANSRIAKRLGTFSAEDIVEMLESLDEEEEEEE